MAATSQDAEKYETHTYKLQLAKHWPTSLPRATKQRKFQTMDHKSNSPLVFTRSLRWDMGNRVILKTKGTGTTLENEGFASLKDNGAPNAVYSPWLTGFTQTHCLCRHCPPRCRHLPKLNSLTLRLPALAGSGTGGGGGGSLLFGLLVGGE